MCNVPDEIRKAILDAAQFYGMMQHGKDYVTDADSDKIYDEYMMIKAWLDSQPTAPEDAPLMIEAMPEKVAMNLQAMDGRLDDRMWPDEWREAWKWLQDGLSLVIEDRDLEEDDGAA